MVAAGIGSRVEGRHAVQAALEAGRVKRLIIEGSRKDSRHIAQRAGSLGVRVQVVDDVRPFAETDVPQGMVAMARPIPYAPFSQLLKSDRDQPPALVVLDRVEDPRNTGAIARSALAAGMTGLVVPRRRSAPITATTFKAAAGALEYLPVASVSSVGAAVDRAGQAGVWTVGLASEAPEMLWEHSLLAQPVAIIVGSEGRGLSRLVRERVDLLLSIPIDARAASLNAGIAAALACFEVQRIRSEAA